MSSEHQHHPQQKPQEEQHFWRTPPGVIALIIIVIIGYYLITEHGAHIASFLGASPFLLIILLCPLMHLFMHKGHGGHGDKPPHQKSDDEDNHSSENKE
ncbi:hypothetical protein Lste_0021 [Legionella steelei]|uniref:DUF2933 domain-containing protein n=1 Tax=Legionella steelei TaxID=947033 RepID=A0A0W0ZRS0_9GAMM|nr:DUF2933 domain-containing protein [Legionella steelei]KTD71736.1 hypothetical protein Lste_0021 [Legionella steelei]